MKSTPFLLMVTLFTFGNFVPNTNADISQIRILIKELLRINYEYTLLSMVLRQSAVAYLGTGELVQKLADDRERYMDMCMNYLIVRRSHFHMIYSLKHNIDTSIVLDYNKMTPYKAINYISEREMYLNNTLTELVADLKPMDKHFIEHNIMDELYDSFSRIQNLLTLTKKDQMDHAYTFELDRSVNFLYRNFFVVPTS